MTQFPGYQFDDADAEGYMLGIAESMVELFGITLDEAIGRINAVAGPDRLIAAGDMVFHETTEYWAKSVYYGRRDYWRFPAGSLTPVVWRP